MVEVNKLNEIESILSQMNGDLASHFSDLIKSTIIETLNLNKNKNEEEVDYKNIYNLHKNNFEIWLKPKFSHNYFVSVRNSLEKIFQNEVSNIIEIKKIIESGKVTPSSASKCFRVFLNYLEENELISDVDLIRARKKIKIITSNNIDKYVPREKEIRETLEILKSHEYPKEAMTIYKFMLESGCRYTELKYLMSNFDESNIEVFGDIITYKNFYLRGSKSSYYLFCSKKTFDELKKIIKYGDINVLSYFKRKLHRTKYLVNLKYLRKYNFTKLIENDVEIEFANFIQGRASKNIGFTNYLAKQRLSIPKYTNFIKNLYLELK
jgi:intergrase/recombinase